MNQKAKQPASFIKPCLKETANKENVGPLAQRKKANKQNFETSRVFKDITREIKLREELEHVFEFF